MKQISADFGKVGTMIRVKYTLIIQSTDPGNLRYPEYHALSKFEKGADTYYKFGYRHFVSINIEKELGSTKQDNQWNSYQTFHMGVSEKMLLIQYLTELGKLYRESDSFIYDQRNHRLKVNTQKIDIAKLAERYSLHSKDGKLMTVCLMVLENTDTADVAHPGIGINIGGARGSYAFLTYDDSVALIAILREINMYTLGASMYNTYQAQSRVPIPSKELGPLPSKVVVETIQDDPIQMIPVMRKPEPSSIPNIS